MHSHLIRKMTLFGIAVFTTIFSVGAVGSVDLSGRVVDMLGNPLGGVIVVLKGMELSDTSAEDGLFAIGGQTAFGIKSHSFEDLTSLRGNQLLCRFLPANMYPLRFSMPRE